MFELLKKELEKEYNGYTANAIKYLTSENDDNCLKRNSTETRWMQYKTGKIDREKAISYAIARTEKANNKKLNSKIEFLDRIAICDTVQSVSITVEWKRNSTWGMNPTATVDVRTATGAIYRATGTASGCGYDKETAAVGSALNEINPIRKMLCEKKENALNNGVTSGDKYNPGNSAYIHYGAGYGAIPYFEGGVGMSSFEGVFNACGLKMIHQNHSNHYGFYYFERQEVAK